MYISIKYMRSVQWYVVCCLWNSRNYSEQKRKYSLLVLQPFLSLNLIFKASAHSFKQFTSRLSKLSFSLSLCTYITRMDVMLDFICMGPVGLTGARRKWQNTKWKIPCPQWDSNPQPFDSKSDSLPTELAGLGECCPFKWPYYIHVLPIPMFTLLYVPEW